MKNYGMQNYGMESKDNSYWASVSMLINKAMVMKPRITLCRPTFFSLEGSRYETC